MVLLNIVRPHLLMLITLLHVLCLLVLLYRPRVEVVVAPKAAVAVLEVNAWLRVET